MIEVIKKAIHICRKGIRSNKISILSEGDLERHLANTIEEIIKNTEDLKDWKVHTQISYYMTSDSTLKYRVDILIMNEKSKMLDSTLHKGFKYQEESFVLEVKYLHQNGSINGVKKDIDKITYLENATLFVVTLFDIENEKKQKSIEDYCKLKQDEYPSRLYSEYIIKPLHQGH